MGLKGTNSASKISELQKNAHPFLTLKSGKLEVGGNFVSCFPGTVLTAVPNFLRCSSEVGITLSLGECYRGNKMTACKFKNEMEEEWRLNTMSLVPKAFI